MKLTCSQSDLNAQLSLAIRAVSTRPTHPILGNILLTATEDGLQLTSFDLALGIQVKLEACVEKQGSITLPAKLFTDIVSRLPNSNLTIETINKGDSEDEDDSEAIAVKITAPSGKYEIRGLSADEFPLLPQITLKKGERPHQLSVKALQEGLHGALFAASTDDTKQVLTGIHLQLKNDCIEFAATDGHRLRVIVSETEGTEELQMTIPAKSLKELERMIAGRKEDEVINLLVDDTQAIFKLEEQQLTSRKLEGAYPDYPQLIPRHFSSLVEIDRKKFIAAIERVSVMSDQKNNLIKFEFGEDQITITVDAQDLGSAREKVPAEISGDPSETIGFNIKYLLDGLKTMQENTIVMKFNLPNAPVIFSQHGKPNDIYLVMPVQIVR